MKYRHHTKDILLLEHVCVPVYIGLGKNAGVQSTPYIYAKKDGCLYYFLIICK